ncbi:MAG: DNA methyltransferase [Armatimonadota bacterium]
MLRDYQVSQRPLEVNFRTLVGAIPIHDLTHSICPYPARLLRQIPRFFLHCEQLSTRDTVVVDPFCGSGTVLVEAVAAGKQAWGIDKNPFARLLSQVKTTHVDCQAANAAALAVLERAKRSRTVVEPEIVNAELWFAPKVRSALRRIKGAISDSKLPIEIERYLLVCLAVTADKCSLRDRRIPVPVRRSDWQQFSVKQDSRTVWMSFEAVAHAVAARISGLPKSTGAAFVYGDDALNVDEFYDASMSGIIQRPSLLVTSPPYGAAQKYIRSSSLAIGWTGLASPKGLTQLERELIGREHLRKPDLEMLQSPSPLIDHEIRCIFKRDPQRAAIYAEYFRAMDKAIAAFGRLLQPGAFSVVIAGTNIVAGRMIETHRFLRDLSVNHGFSPVLELRDTIRGRTLLTKRASTARPLSHETIHVLQRR